MVDMREKISKAIRAYEGLERGKGLDREIERLSMAIREVRNVMHSLSIPQICRKCDVEEGGSCCGRGIEAYYDEPILLLNRLLGVELPMERKDGESCLFLGSEGCVLIARHALCVNYMCEKLLERFSTDDLRPLKEAEGLELELTFRICERLRQSF